MPNGTTTITARKGSVRNLKPPDSPSGLTRRGSSLKRRTSSVRSIPQQEQTLLQVSPSSSLSGRRASASSQGQTRARRRSSAHFDHLGPIDSASLEGVELQEGLRREALANRENGFWGDILLTMRAAEIKIQDEQRAEFFQSEKGARWDIGTKAGTFFRLFLTPFTELVESELDGRLGILMEEAVDYAFHHRSSLLSLEEHIQRRDLQAQGLAEPLFQYQMIRLAVSELGRRGVVRTAQLGNRKELEKRLQINKEEVKAWAAIIKLAKGEHEKVLVVLRRKWEQERKADRESLEEDEKMSRMRVGDQRKIEMNRLLQPSYKLQMEELKSRKTIATSEKKSHHLLEKKRHCQEHAYLEFHLTSKLEEEERNSLWLQMERSTLSTVQRSHRNKIKAWEALQGQALRARFTIISQSMAAIALEREALLKSIYTRARADLDLQERLARRDVMTEQVLARESLRISVELLDEHSAGANKKVIRVEQKKRKQLVALWSLQAKGYAARLAEIANEAEAFQELERASFLDAQLAERIILERMAQRGRTGISKSWQFDWKVQFNWVEYCFRNQIEVRDALRKEEKIGRLLLLNEAREADMRREKTSEFLAFLGSFGKRSVQQFDAWAVAEQERWKTDRVAMEEFHTIERQGMLEEALISAKPFWESASELMTLAAWSRDLCGEEIQARSAIRQSEVLRRGLTTSLWFGLEADQTVSRSNTLQREEEEWQVICSMEREEGDEARETTRVRLEREAAARAERKRIELARRKQLERDAWHLEAIARDGMRKLEAEKQAAANQRDGGRKSKKAEAELARTCQSERGFDSRIDNCPPRSSFLPSITHTQTSNCMADLYSKKIKRIDEAKYLSKQTWTHSPHSHTHPRERDDYGSEGDALAPDDDPIPFGEEEAVMLGLVRDSPATPAWTDPPTTAATLPIPSPSRSTCHGYLPPIARSPVTGLSVSPRAAGWSAATSEAPAKRRPRTPPRPPSDPTEAERRVAQLNAQGVGLLEKSRPESAQIFFEQALALTDEPVDFTSPENCKHLRATTISNLASVALHLGSAHKAVDLFQKSLILEAGTDTAAAAELEANAFQRTGTGDGLVRVGEGGRLVDVWNAPPGLLVNLSSACCADRSPMAVDWAKWAIRLLEANTTADPMPAARVGRERLMAGAWQALSAALDFQLDLSHASAKKRATNTYGMKSRQKLLAEAEHARSMADQCLQACR